MKLSWKVPLVIGASFVCATLLLYFAWQKILLGGFRVAEQQNMDNHLARVNAALFREVDGIDTSCSDWGNWDDTYHFVQDLNQDYLVANLTPNAFATLGLDIIAFADNQGKIIYGRIYDPANDALVPLSRELADCLLNECKVMLPGEEVITGICSEHQPILFSARPILDSDGNGPARGRIFFGRYMTNNELQQISELLLVKIKLITLEETNRDFRLAAIREALTKGSYSIVQAENKRVVDGYFLEKDFLGQPAFLLKVSCPRSIYARGEQARLSSLAALGFFGTIFLLLGTGFLHKALLSRLASLSSTVREIASRKTVSTRVAVMGKDELAGLGRDINIMLDGLEQSETERLRSEEKLRNMVEVASDWMWEVDAQGRYTYASGQVARILGYEPEEIIGKTPLDFMPPEEAQRVGEIFSRIVADKAPICFLENLNLHRDGHPVVLETNGVPVFSGSGEFQGYVGMDRDITARKQAEAALRQARDDAERVNAELEQTNVLLQKSIQDANQMAVEAEAANAAKSAFLANMSHEIRTPMNVILGMTDLALQTKLNEEQKEFLREVQQAADTLLALINDILDLSKIEAGKLQIESVALELRDTVMDAAKIMAVKAHQKNLELTCQIAPEVPEYLLGDPLRLRQVLINLLGNAIKFTERGEIAIHGEVITQTEQQVFLHFTVRDTGIGIPQHKQREIFEAFTQADGSTTRKYGGTGLGLTISSQLVRMMGGQLWVESTPNQGSTFHFTGRFNLQDIAAVQIVAPPEDLLGLPVLVVDDHPSNRKIMEKMLLHWRMRPVCADGAAEAFEEIAKAKSKGRSFALILMDANMPEMDGLDLAKKINQFHLPDCKIILLTSSGQFEDPSYYRSLGIAACLAKPIRESDLLRTVITLMNGPRPEKIMPPVKTVPGAGPGRQLRILLAEDNRPTQKLMLHILEKRGHLVTLANHGLEAVEHYKSGPFDLILMDAQMPEMDGLQATAAIREIERGRGGHTPIIALTAHAMQGDKEHCLASGMDAYISKPVNPGELFAAIAGLLAGENPTPAPIPGRKEDEPVLDQKELLRRVDGDLELLRELAEEFLEDCPRLLSEVQQAVVAGDAGTLEKAAHKLKGVTGTFAAKAASSAAQELENLGRQTNLARAEVAYSALEQEIELLKPALQAIAKGKDN